MTNSISDIDDLLEAKRRDKKVQVSVYVNRSILKEVRSICKARNLPLSALLDVLLASWLASHNEKVSLVEHRGKKKTPARRTTRSRAD